MTIREDQLEDFARWVAAEVTDEELWTYNYLAFAELACRKLAQLGMMQKSDKEYLYEVLEDRNDHTDAKWEEMSDPVGGSIPWIVCSNCGGEAIRDNFDKYKLTDYCPNCGAKMAKCEVDNGNDD